MEITSDVEHEILEHLLKTARGIKHPQVVTLIHLALGYHTIRSKALVVGRRNCILVLGVNRVDMTMELFRMCSSRVTKGSVDYVRVYYSLPLSDPRCLDHKHMAAAVRVHDQTLDAPVLNEYQVFKGRR